MLKGFLRACEKGFDDMQADPDGVLQILLDNQNEENFPCPRPWSRRAWTPSCP